MTRSRAQRATEALALLLGLSLLSATAFALNRPPLTRLPTVVVSKSAQAAGIVRLPQVIVTGRRSD